jgi:D-sedoheptulose 7-phosphate isomerase
MNFINPGIETTGGTFHDAVAMVFVQGGWNLRGKIYFVGNGGSAGICSHMAADWLKNGHFRAMCFNDPALLTCLSNDLGYGSVFSEPLKIFGERNDVLFAISSSGQSINIINAVHAAKLIDMKVITLSGFAPDNPLRTMGDINFYVPSHKYGTVEIAHLSICHAILDKVMEQ